MLKNIYFDIALKNAARLLGKKRRLLLVLTRLGVKLKDVNWKEINAADVRNKFAVIGRLAKAYALGRYRSIPWKSLLLITGAILYFVTPVDFIPDVIPGIGLSDDIGILLAIYQSIHDEVEKFLSWEKSRIVQE